MDKKNKSLFKCTETTDKALPIVATAVLLDRASCSGSRTS